MDLLAEAGYADAASVGIAGGGFALLFLLGLLFSVSQILVASFSFTVAEQINNNVLRIGQVLVPLTALLTLCFISKSSSLIQEEMNK